MIEFIQSWLPSVQNLGMLGYWLLLAITFGESFVLTGIFVPGTVMVVIMGGLAQAGYYDFYDLVFFAVCGSILGDAVSYEIGRAGRLHAENFPFVRRYFARGKAFFLEHQGKSIFMGRFIGPIRPIIPFIAGVMDMKRGQFYLLNILSAIAWSFSYVSLGYVFGYAWKNALAWSSAGVATLVVIMAVVIGSAYHAKKHQCLK